MESEKQAIEQIAHTLKRLEGQISNFMDNLKGQGFSPDVRTVLLSQVNAYQPAMQETISLIKKKLMVIAKDEAAMRTILG